MHDHLINYNQHKHISTCYLYLSLPLHCYTSIMVQQNSASENQFNLSSWCEKSYHIANIYVPQLK